MLRYLLLLSLVVGLRGAIYHYHRLPKSVLPLEYDIKVLTHIEDAKNYIFEGRTRILLQVLQDTNNVTLHASALEIKMSQAFLQNKATKEVIGITMIDMQDRYEYYVLYLNGTLKRDERYLMQLEYTGEIKTDSEREGFFRSSYVDPRSNQTRYLVATQFQPTHARTAFPCFDEPDLKAKFTITLGHHKKFTSLSNMPLREMIPHKTLKNYIWCAFEETVPMSSYLVAFTVNDFQHTITIRTKNDVEFRSWTRPDSTFLQSMEYANGVGYRILQFFESFFDIKYPLPKVDMIALPQFRGAMENWGLVTFQETNLLYSTKAGLNDKNEVALVVAHELAHQWFGNLVTLNWWSDTWLNEGFATYISALGLGYTEPKLDILNQDVLKNIISMFDVDAEITSNSVSRPVTEISEIAAAFDEFSYKKGGVVLRMLHHFIGNESFVGGLRDYLKKYAYQNTVKEDLWNALEVAARKNGNLVEHNLATIMDSWITQPGFPVINVTRNYKTGTVTITQQRFLNDRQISTQNNCWWIPLTYTTANKPHFNHTEAQLWFTCPKNNQSSTELKVVIEMGVDAKDWVLFNNQMTGFYKINYDLRNWDLLIDTLNHGPLESIHELNRGQLLEDSLNFAWNNQLDYDIAMRITNYLRREYSYGPWVMALARLKKLASILQHMPEYKYFQWYVQQITQPIYKHLGGMSNNFDSLCNRNSALKTQIVGWACFHNVDDCVKKSWRLFDQWRATPHPDKQNPVPLELRSTVYCTAIRRSFDDDWFFLFDRYNNSTDMFERGMILSSLACTRTAWIINHFVKLLTSNEIVGADSITALEAVTNQDVGFHLTKAYVLENFASLLKSNTTRPVAIETLLKALAREVITLSDVRGLMDIVETHKPELQARGIIKNVEEEVKEMSETFSWRRTNAYKVAEAIMKLKNK